jgi:hypothetical protein
MIFYICTGFLILIPSEIEYERRTRELSKLMDPLVITKYCAEVDTEMNWKCKH